MQRSHIVVRDCLADKAQATFGRPWRIAPKQKPRAKVAARGRVASARALLQ